MVTDYLEGPDHDFIAEMGSIHAGTVGRLHAEYMPGSPLSSFGPDLLGPLYRCLLESGYGLGFVLIQDAR